MTRLLVVGYGSIGYRHAENLQSFDDVEVHVCDLDAKRLPEDGDVETSTDFDRALDWAPDAVLICTPPNTHLKLARTAVAAGAHVFVEKPLSHSLDGIDEFVEEAERLDRTVLVGCNMRFHPPVVKIQEWLDEGLIGQVQFVRLRYGNYLPNWRPTDYRESYSADPERGGGIILDAIHELDLAREWVESPDGVYCAAGRLGDLDIETEDTAEILLDGDRLASIHVDYLRFERARTYELLGSEGMIHWTARGKNPEQSTVELHRPQSDTREGVEYESTLNEMYVAEMEHFLACVRDGDEPRLDARGGRDVLELALRARESARRRRRQPL